MNLEDLVVGETYECIEDGKWFEVIYCGLNEYEVPIIETIRFDAKTGVGSLKPKHWIPKGTNTYWSFRGIQTLMRPCKSKIRNDKLKQLGI